MEMGSSNFVIFQTPQTSPLRLARQEIFSDINFFQKLTSRSQDMVV